MTDISAPMKSRSDGNARSFTRRGAAIPRHRPDGVPDRGRSVRHAGDPSLADPALQRDPGRDGLCGQCQHHGHGGRRARGRLPEPAYRPPARHSRQPGPARDPHHAAGERARSHRVHDPARRAGPVHGVGVRADAGLSRRAMQFDGCRRRVRRLYHRQRRQQSDRAAGVGRSRRYARAGLEFLFLRAAQSRRRGAGLLHHPARQADACDARGAIAVRGHDRALAQPGAARRPSPSASASCSPSSAPLPSSISCWCARRCRSGGWISASSISCSRPPSSRRCSPAGPWRGSARGRRSGARSRSPLSACR